MWQQHMRCCQTLKNESCMTNLERMGCGQGGQAGQAGLVVLVVQVVQAASISKAVIPLRWWDFKAVSWCLYAA